MSKMELKRFNYSFIGAVLAGLFAHLFALTNVLKNHDNIVWEGYGTGITSGRWFLSFLGDWIGKIWGNYNIPFFNGILSILMLALTAYIVVLIFDIREPVFCVLWGAVFLSFPTVTGTMFYMYTVPYYALAILMTVFAVYVTEKYRFGFLLSAVLSGCALGIYQAYYPMMISLYLMLLIVKLLFYNETVLYYIKCGLLYLGTLILTLAFYFVSLRLMLRYYGVSLSNYYNVDQMGQIVPSEIPDMLKRTYKEFLKLPLQDHYGMSSTPVLRISILLLGIISAVLIVYILWKNGWRKNIARKLMALVCIALFPAAINSITIMCYHSKMYTLMIYAFVFVYLVPMLLLEYCFKGQILNIRKRIGGALHRIVVIIVGLVCLNYTWLSNGNYTTMYYTNEQTYHYLNSFLTQVKSTEGFDTSMKWALIGDDFSDPLYRNPMADTPFNYGGNKYMLINEYSRNAFIRRILGYDVAYAEPEIIDELKDETFVQKMPVYPNDGSIVIYEDMVVIKLEE